MKCSTCNARATNQCGECGEPICRVHSNTLFEEETRSFTNLCGTCFSKKRQVWIKERL